MNYTVPLVNMKLYYNDKVYSPEYTSLSSILIADKIIKDMENPRATVLDVGCGTGILGLGIKKLNPMIELTLCDTDVAAVKVAKLNSKRLGLHAEVQTTDLMPASRTWDIVVANLPTFSDEDMKQELHGPSIAYYSKEPLGLYKRLFKDAKGRCRALVCECQAKYQEPFLKLAQESGWELILSSEMSFAFTAKRAKN